MIELGSENILRKSGVLMHLSSLPSPYGIGTMGQAARDFVDFLQESGQAYWQILPICPTSYGNSPYQSYSTFAGNPYFIDLDELKNMGILCCQDYENVAWMYDLEQVDYGILNEKRFSVLQKAAKNFLENPTEEFHVFCTENEEWLPDYALFMALKEAHEGKPWSEWMLPYRNRDERAIVQAKYTYEMKINFWKVFQFFFFKQWQDLKKYANKKGIEIIGDLPIYVSLDSVDVWSHPELFQLDENRNPTKVAGCPPDAFSDDGQLWGNPLYNWDYMEKNGFQWWIQRIQYICKVYDVVRIDHFRGFDSYYAIPFGEKTAQNGVWKKGPGMKFFRKLEEEIGRQRIIAEDLGDITESVRKLLEESGFPGMKVLEFAFDSNHVGENEYLPHNFVEKCVAYAGTHDNNTIEGWFEEITEDDAEYAREYLRLTENNQSWGMLQALWESPAGLVIAQMQDILSLGQEARMNTPSTLENNWSWRVRPEVFTHALAYKLRNMTTMYGRLQKK